jgi:hypothetical protein
MRLTERHRRLPLSSLATRFRRPRNEGTVQTRTPKKYCGRRWRPPPPGPRSSCPDHALFIRILAARASARPADAPKRAPPSVFRVAPGGLRLNRRGPGRFRKREKVRRRPFMRRLAFKLGSCAAALFQFLYFAGRVRASAWRLGLKPPVSFRDGRSARSPEPQPPWRMMPKRAQKLSAQERAILDRVTA